MAVLCAILADALVAPAVKALPIPNPIRLTGSRTASLAKSFTISAFSPTVVSPKTLSKFSYMS